MVSLDADDPREHNETGIEFRERLENFLGGRKGRRPRVFDAPRGAAPTLFVEADYSDLHHRVPKSSPRRTSPSGAFLCMCLIFLQRSEWKRLERKATI
jgi:hypothetical protein